MECQSSDSKKLFKVFDASKRKRTRKKRDGLDDTNSLATDDSASGCPAITGMRVGVGSAKASLQNVPTAQTVAAAAEAIDAKRDRDSSPSVSRSPARGDHRACRSPRRHRRSTREGLSLALKSGLVSTPRSNSPRQEVDSIINSSPKNQDSFIYAFLEEAVKRDKKRQRHTRRHDEHRVSRDRDGSTPRDRHQHRRRRDDNAAKERSRERSKKEELNTSLDQNVLFETFAKLCSQLTNKSAAFYTNTQVPRTLSHKSLQCQVSRRDTHNDVHHPVHQRSNEHSIDNVSKTRSHDNFRANVYNQEKLPIPPRVDRQDKCRCCYEKDQYTSKVNMTKSRMRNVDDERHQYPDHLPPRNNLDTYRSRVLDQKDYRDYNRDYYAKDRHYEQDKRRYYDQKTSRSFDVHREGYPDDEKFCRRTARSDNIKDKHYDDRDKYYEEKRDPIESRDRFAAGKDRRPKRNVDRCDRNSVVSRDEDYRDRDRYSERERDSGLSVADGETSTVSGKSNYLRVVKQEIAEQRETMDKMMKLWKELMRCFKGLSAAQGQNKSVQDSAANVEESAAAQLRLWRECMRRYETVARDVGDTDARLMQTMMMMKEEINKQRSEMAEMAGMWQECLQRYREMSTEFTSLKQQVNITKQQQLAVPLETPTRLPAPPVVCAEGEGSIPPAPYRLPPHYPQMPPMPGEYAGGSPLRSRASAPPAWWWCGNGRERDARDSPRRRSSPESRGSRDRRHRHKDRDDSRYKEKSSKPNAARSEHRNRKR